MNIDNKPLRICSKTTTSKLYCSKEKPICAKNNNNTKRECIREKTFNNAKITPLVVRSATHKNVNSKTRKNIAKRMLPKLKPSLNKNKKYHYRLEDGPRSRRLAIDEGIDYETKHTNRTRKQAAIAKKGRLNILRIYRKNSNPKHCNKITRDMRYIDKKYNLGKTTSICKK